MFPAKSPGPSIQSLGGGNLVYIIKVVVVVEALSSLAPAGSSACAVKGSSPAPPPLLPAPPRAGRSTGQRRARAGPAPPHAGRSPGQRRELRLVRQPDWQRRLGGSGPEVLRTAQSCTATPILPNPGPLPPNCPTPLYHSRTAHPGGVTPAALPNPTLSLPYCPPQQNVSGGSGPEVVHAASPQVSVGPLGGDSGVAAGAGAARPLVLRRP